MKRFRYSQLAIKLILIFSFVSFVTAAFASPNAGIYLNTVDRDVSAPAAQPLDIPVFVLSGDLYDKQADVFIWIETVKDKNNAPAQSLFLNSDVNWEPFITNTHVKPLANISKIDSRYYNFIYTYDKTNGFNSFDLYLCLKEGAADGPIDSSLVKSQGVCGFRSFVVTQTCNSSLNLNPTTLSAQTLVSGSKGTAVSVYVKDGCGVDVDAANYTVTPDKSWIAISDKGTGRFYVTLDATSSTLTPPGGPYTGDITVSNGVASSKISASLTVTPKSNTGGGIGKPNEPFPGGGGGTCTPTLSVSWPATLTATAGQTVTTSVNVTDNCGKKPQYTTQIVSTTGGSWLSVPSSGSGPLTITARTTGMAGGTYTGTFKVNSTGLGESSVTVTLVVTGPCTVSSVAPISPLSVSAVTGSNATSTSFNVTDNCYTNLGYTINSVSATSATGAPWISSPVPGDTGTGTVTIRFASSALAVGQYTGYINLTAAGYPNAVRVTVNLTVSNAPASGNNGNAQGFPSQYVQVNANNHTGSVRFSMGPNSTTYYYFTTIFPSSVAPLAIMMQGQSNYEPNTDMLVRYAGKSCDGSLPTSADMVNAFSYQQANGASDCSSNILPCSPPRYRNDLYYNIVGNSFELITINDIGGYPKGCYYIMITNKGTTTARLSLNYSETNK